MIDVSSGTSQIAGEEYATAFETIRVTESHAEIATQNNRMTLS